MMLLQSSRSAQQLFSFAALLIVFWINSKIYEPLPFFFMGCGVVTFSFFLRRAIHQFVQGR